VRQHPNRHRAKTGGRRRAKYRALRSHPRLAPHSHIPARPERPSTSTRVPISRTVPRPYSAGSQRARGAVPAVRCGYLGHLRGSSRRPAARLSGCARDRVEECRVRKLRDQVHSLRRRAFISLAPMVAPQIASPLECPNVRPALAAVLEPRTTPCRDPSARVARASDHLGTATRSRFAASATEYLDGSRRPCDCGTWHASQDPVRVVRRRSYCAPSGRNLRHARRS